MFIPHVIEERGFASAVRWTALLMAGLLTVACLTISVPDVPQKYAKRPSDGLAPLKDMKRWSWILYFAGAFLIMYA